MGDALRRVTTLCARDLAFDDRFSRFPAPVLTVIQQRHFKKLDPSQSACVTSKTLRWLVIRGRHASKSRTYSQAAHDSFATCA